MLKRLQLSILLLIMFFGSAYASPWDDYIELREQYYNLDKEGFDEITCQIEVPLMSNVVEQVKVQLSPLQEKIQFAADLSKFTVTYTPHANLRFTRPLLDFSLKTKEGIADIAKVKSGIETTKQGFKRQVDGTIQTLEGVLQEYATPKEKEFEKVKILPGADKISVSYTKEGSRVNETYSGNTITGTQKNSAGSVSYTLKYDKNSKNKFIIKSANTTVSQPVTKIKLSSTISYQNLEEVYFPKQIKSYFEQEIQSIKQQAEIIINLTNCTKK